MFDRKRLKLETLAKREHELASSEIMPLGKVDYVDEPLRKVAARIIKARNNKSIILMIGGHVIRSGVQEYLIDLICMLFVNFFRCCLFLFPKNFHYFLSL